MKDPIEFIFCQICGSQFLTAFQHVSRTCSEPCNDRFNLLLKQASKILIRKKTFRIAELDTCPQLDTLERELKALNDVIVDRYTIPEHAQPIFRNAPPEAALDFPILTIIDGKNESRFYGLSSVTQTLRAFIPSRARTRAIKRKLVSK